MPIATAVRVCGSGGPRSRNVCPATAEEDDLLWGSPIAISAILVAVFVLNTYFHPTRRSTFIVGAAVTISVCPISAAVSSAYVAVHIVAVALHSVTPTLHHLSAHPHVIHHSRHFVPTHGTHTLHHSPHAMLSHTAHLVAVAWLRSPIAIDLDVLRPILTLLNLAPIAVGFARAAQEQSGAE